VRWFGASAALLLILIVPLSSGLALWIRRRYVAAIARLQRGARPPASPLGSPTAARTSPRLEIVIEDASSVFETGAARAALQLRRRVLRAQFLCGVAFWYAFLFLAAFGSAFVGGVVEAIRSGDAGLLRLVVSLWVGLPLEGDCVNRSFFLALVLGPSAVVWGMQAGLAMRHVFACLAAAAAALVWATSRSSGGWMPPIALAGGLGGLAIAISVLTSPRIRGASVPLIATLSLGATVWLAAGLGAEHVLLDGRAGATLAADSGGLDLVLVSVSSLPALAASFAALSWLARGYEMKRLSDVQLAQLGFWALAALAALAIGSAFQAGGQARLAGELTALTACWLSFWLGLRRWQRGILRKAPAPLGPLLVLRVFKGAAHSEAFMDRLMSFWRFAAPVWMIGGTDLAGANMEPGEFFAFLRGRLAERFIRSRDEIPDRIARLDGGRDPDARFRISELYCTEETWQPTVVSLIERAGVVLLDLREFRPERAGTRYEVQELMNLASLRKVVPVIGAGDDEAVICSELRLSWSAMSDASPNRRSGDVVLKLRRVRRAATGDIRGLFTSLASVSASADG
jgi:hypothetical protein